MCVEQHTRQTISKSKPKVSPPNRDWRTRKSMIKLLLNEGFTIDEMAYLSDEMLKYWIYERFG